MSGSIDIFCQPLEPEDDRPEPVGAADRIFVSLFRIPQLREKVHFLLFFFREGREQSEADPIPISKREFGGSHKGFKGKTLENIPWNPRILEP